MTNRIAIMMGEAHDILLGEDEIGNGWILIETNRSKGGILTLKFQDKKKWNERVKVDMIDNFSVEANE